MPWLPIIDRLSQRERRLAETVGVLLIVCAIFFQIVMPIMFEWQRQGSEIERLTNRFDLLRRILEMGPGVDAKYDEYRELLAQESSDEAVRNELMQDISAISGRSGLRVPVIREGSTDSYRYYKRYVVEMDISGMPGKIFSFLANLQKSKKLFRIEGLNVARKGNVGLTGTMVVSKILVPADHKERFREARQAVVELQQKEPTGNLVVNGDMELWSTGWGKDRYPDSWSATKITTAYSTEHAVTGSAAARATGLDRDSTLYQDVNVDPASGYKLTAHMSLISGKVWLRVRDMGQGGTYYGEGEGPMSAKGGSMRAYSRTFTTMGGSGGAKRTLRIALHFRAKKSAVCIDDVRLVKLGKSDQGVKEK